MVPLGVTEVDFYPVSNRTRFAIRNQQNMGRTSPPSPGRMVHEIRHPQDKRRNIAHHLDIVLGAEWDPYVCD